MGGSGGGGGYPDAGNGMERLRERAAEQAEQAQFDGEVNELLNQELHGINDRDVNLVRQRLDEIFDALRDQIEEIDRILFGGSIAKHTFVDGLSDVDVLVLLKNITDIPPDQARAQFADALRERLGADAEVDPGTLAVTVRYRDGMELQLLPAIERGDRRAISSPSGTEWVEIRPGNFAKRLTELNRAQAGAAIPAVKLAKTIVSNVLPEANRPTGYHLEALSVAAFENYRGARDPKSMLTHFFTSAAANVRNPIRDITGQSEHVDEYLGGRDSTARTQMSAALGAVSQRMQTSRTRADWNDLLG